MHLCTRAVVTFCVGSMLLACASSLPTPAEETRVDDYGKARERCKDDAKARDADIDDYRRCAAQVDRDYGRAGAADGGTDG